MRRSTEALQALGHQIEIATADPVGTAPPAGTNFPFHPLGGFTADKLGAWLQRERERFDAVLVQGLWQAGATVRASLRGTRIPYFVFPHGMLDPWIARAYPLKHFKKQLYWWWREGRVLRDAAAVCFTCEEERRLAQKTFVPYSAKERVVAYGTAAPPAGHDALRAVFQQQFPALAARPFVLFLSRIHDKKGVDELIAGYATFRQANPDTLALAIAGPCEDPRYLDKLQASATAAGLTQLDLRENQTADSSAADVVWLPMLGDELKWGALLTAEAFILPSHQENFGLAVAEALACRRPVLISNKVNIWREISSANAGLVSADTADGVNDLLTRWAALDQSSRDVMGAAAQACFGCNFEISHAAQSLVGTVRQDMNR